jgi:hypothetical protein
MWFHDVPKQLTIPFLLGHHVAHGSSKLVGNDLKLGRSGSWAFVQIPTRVTIIQTDQKAKSVLVFDLISLNECINDHDDNG